MDSMKKKKKKKKKQKSKYRRRAIEVPLKRVGWYRLLGPNIGSWLAATTVRLVLY